MMLPIANAILESLFGDLETLRQKCKSKEETEDDIMIGTLHVFTVLLTNHRPIKEFKDALQNLNSINKNAQDKGG